MSRPGPHPEYAVPCPLLTATLNAPAPASWAHTLTVWVPSVAITS